MSESRPAPAGDDLAAGLAQVDELARLRESAARGGGAHRLEELKQQGKLSARERIARLVDPDSFWELGALAHSDVPGQQDRSWSDGLVFGLARVGGREVAVEATDRTVLAGTEGRVFWRKLEYFHELAERRQLPVFNLAEGGGLRMPDNMGSEGISASPQPLAFTYLPSHASKLPPSLAPVDPADRNIEDILSLVPVRRNKGYDVRRVVELLVDRDGEHSSAFELKPDFGRALYTGLARIRGVPVGILASNPMRGGGALGPQECDKATEFTVLCDSFHLPIVYLHDVPGFAVGSRFEHAKLATKIMVWKQADAHATVPRISVVMRKSIGAAFGAMMGARQGADMILAWPGAEINFTGLDVGINVVHHRELSDAEDPDAVRDRLRQEWGETSSPYRAAASYRIEDVIDPRDTRKHLCRWLEMAGAARQPGERLLANWPTGY